MNNIYFLCSLPRAGNTLFGSIVNQSQHVKVTANTILTDVIYQLQLVKEYEIYKNFPNEKSLDNIIKNVFNNYYENWKVDNIIDFIDNGKGIHRNQMTDIFKPGFTTKKRGWGLGLSLAKRIIEDYHKGQIFVKESNPFVKTTFRIILEGNT